ncbi:hypothetical protein ACJMK2_028810 [Sinanodonta woodiana]|uniref:THAP-type domain-containing protein n=1 Tax=Sinanodonta woodiana TaxID=1069815 RepID=A0ABD3XBU4_SINWO
MVQCAALNCTVKSGQGFSVYLFPKEPHLRKIWTVKLKRDNFVPSDYTKLCERHFEKGQFVMNPEVAASVGFRPKSKMLVNGAIPTLFDLSDPKDKHGKWSLTQTQTSKPSRKCSVIEKRRRLEVN